MAFASVDSLNSAMREKYLPAEREGSALCLSGGGYRAALFHLGVCRRLNEIGVLAKFDSISAVSGGSIFASHLARVVATKPDWSKDYETNVAVPFREFVSHDIRTSAALARLHPWEWWNAGAAAEDLAKEYDELLLDGMTLAGLPQKPNFIFCATDVCFGVNWEFSRTKTGDFQAGYMAKADSDAFPVSRAVAASSCFPPVFSPMPMQLQPASLTGGRATGTDRDDCVKKLALSDGGVYDNMGLEPVWKTCSSVIVSDGGKPFQFAKESDTPHELYRLVDVMGNQAEALRKRWLIASYLQKIYSGVYLGIHNSVSDYLVGAPLGYSKDFVLDVLSKVRTDMDHFSDDETFVIENHGYTVTDAAYHAHVDPSVSALGSLPHPGWLSSLPQLGELEAELRRQLSDSSVVHVLGH